MSENDPIAVIAAQRHTVTMKKMIFALALGVLLGWFARWYVDTDSCLDAGGKWESRGGYCFGARSADPTGS